MMSADDVAMMWQMTSSRADVSRGTLARGGAWRKLEARDTDAETSVVRGGA